MNLLDEINSKIDIITVSVRKLQNATLPNLLSNKGSATEKIIGIDRLIELRPVVGSKSTVYKKCMNRAIPHSKRDGTLVFDLDEIDQWLLANKVKCVGEETEDLNAYLKNKSQQA